MNKPRIFISHSWKYDDYDKLVNLLDGRGYFEYQSSSVPSSDPLSGSNKAVWDAIDNKIRWCQVVLLTAGVHASYSGSIKREIDFAKRLGKSIIAIIPHQIGQVSSLRGHATEVVHWRVESIVAAIRRYT
jgi:hypothetical protein